MNPQAFEPSRKLVVCSLLAVLSSLLLVSPAVSQTVIGDRALEQIAAAIEEKSTRSAAQKKIGSDLLVPARLARGEAPAALALESVRVYHATERIEIDVFGLVDEDLSFVVAQLGGTTHSLHTHYGAMRVSLPWSEIEQLAQDHRVHQIRSADRAFQHMINVTEGDVAHGADVARVTFGVDGTGVMTCAMSDGVDSLGLVQGSGDLPGGVTVLPGQAGTGTEGTALLEIIHDMAPGSELAFATGQGGQAQMATNIIDLRLAGCDIIVDDILYFAEGVFQDDVIAQAVEDVVADGAIYITSAGNSGRLNAGTAGVFEGDYSAAALPPALVGAGASAHDFGGGDTLNEVTLDSPFFFTLQWSDPLDGSTNDFDLFLLNPAASAVVAFSTFTQSGTQDPFEFIDTTAADHTGHHLVVVDFNAPDPSFIHLNTHRGTLEHGTDGQIFGHPGAVGALTVAAVDVATAGGGQFVGGAANPVEFFSSDGPRRIFFEADGTPIAESLAGFAGIPEGVERQKPDVAAADGVSTATPGFNPFFGTSASAPHAAGISALFVDLFPSIDAEDAYDAFRSSALDIDPFGFDRDSGFGIIKAENALNPPNMIFVDGFESGNTSAWTSTVGE